MSTTAHKTKEELVEHIESTDDMKKHAKVLAQWIRESKHVVFFTGAGISTSVGIPDFRGPEGVWTLRAQGKSPKSGVSSIKAIPSPTHCAIAELIRRGLCASVISQNTDGLHRKTLGPDKIAELHGNTNLEKCESCGAQYMRDYRTRNAHGVHSHRTGRKCEIPGCGGHLCDSIINFGENLPERDINMGFNEAKKSDLMICMGSSLRVTPAADMPCEVGERGDKLCIVNLQTTPLDKICGLRVYAKCDDFMAAVMAELDIPIPKWLLRRRFVVYTRNKLHVKGVDTDGKPSSFIKSVSLVDHGKVLKKKMEEPFILPVSQTGALRLEFFGHYNEPCFDVELPITDETIDIAYDVSTREWHREDLVAKLEGLSVV